MHNILHYGKVVQNPGWQTLDPVLNAPEYYYYPLSQEWTRTCERRAVVCKGYI